MASHSVLKCVTSFKNDLVKRLYISFMHEEKVTKLGSLKLHLPKSAKVGSIIGCKIDYKALGVF